MRAANESFNHPSPRPLITTDVVVFAIRDDRLSTLLVRYASGPWALPGSHPAIDEHLNDAAARELRSQTGLKDLYLEQLYTFGDPHRYPQERLISVSYFAVVPQHRLTDIRPAHDGQRLSAWFPCDALPMLAHDHADIVALAHRRLVAKLSYSTIAFRFLAETFTLGQLQSVYESLQQQTIDKRNFRKRIMSMDLIEPTGESQHNGKSRPARVYRALAGCRT